MARDINPFEPWRPDDSLSPRTPEVNPLDPWRPREAEPSTRPPSSRPEAPGRGRNPGPKPSPSGPGPGGIALVLLLGLTGAAAVGSFALGKDLSNFFRLLGGLS